MMILNSWKPSILPYGDQLLVKIKGEEYLIVDQFCLLPKCKCTDVTLDLVPAGEDAMMADPGVLCD